MSPAYSRLLHLSFRLRLQKAISMSEHIVSSFDEELNGLSQKIAEMGGLAEQSVADSVAALVSRDVEKAQRVIASDQRIDKLQQELEESAILMIAKRQPMARDLREIMAAIHIANDLERVGDLAKNTAKRVIAIESNFGSQRLVAGVEHMAELSLTQLKEILDAFAGRDLAAAHSVWEHDTEIDAMYTSLCRELLTYMMEDPRNITFCTRAEGDVARVLHHVSEQFAAERGVHRVDLGIVLPDAVGGGEVAAGEGIEDFLELGQAELGHVLDASDQALGTEVALDGDDPLGGVLGQVANPLEIVGDVDRRHDFAQVARQRLAFGDHQDGALLK